MLDITALLENAMKPVGTTLYVWGGGWDVKDTAAGETALYIGVYPQWETYFNNHRKGYSYLPGKRAWACGERRWRLYGLDCSGFVGWAVYNSMQSGRKAEGYVIRSTKYAETMAQYGYGAAMKCTPYGTFCPGDIISMDGHVILSLGQCSDGSVLLVHSTPNGGVQVSGTYTNGISSQASELAMAFMQKNFPRWWSSFGNEGRQKVSADIYLNSIQFTWMSSSFYDTQGLRSMTANQVLTYLERTINN